MRRSIVLFCLGCSLIVPACIPSGPAPPAPAVAEQAAQAERAEHFAEKLATLPGAQIEKSDGGGVVIRYPEQVLFADGAALPFPGGRELLDPLCDLLLLQPTLPWQGTVRVTPGTGAGLEQALAEKRVELLTRYFARRGLPAGVPALHADVAAGAPLELVLQGTGVIPVNSPAAKE